MRLIEVCGKGIHTLAQESSTTQQAGVYRTLVGTFMLSSAQFIHHSSTYFFYYLSNL
jgi:hypothetical protein